MAHISVLQLVTRRECSVVVGWGVCALVVHGAEKNRKCLDVMLDHGGLGRKSRGKYVVVLVL